MGRASRSLPLPSLEKQWSIGIYAGADLWTLRPATAADNPVMTARQVADVPALFVADPFMVQHDGTWYMFFEVFRADTLRGDIGMATSADGLSWTYKRIVLHEPFHLSYPYVFVSNSEFYMIPETHACGEVRLYRARSFPESWVLEQVLLTDDTFTDTSIVEFHQKWWLFTSLSGDGTLCVFHANAVGGPWIPHLRNPISSNARDRSLGAGRIVTVADRIVRVAQDCSESYGLRVNAFEIREISETEYAEGPAQSGPLLTGSGRGWNARGMHHIDAHQVASGRWIACVDGFRKRWMLGRRRWPQSPVAP